MCNADTWQVVNVHYYVSLLASLSRCFLRCVLILIREMSIEWANRGSTTAGKCELAEVEE